MSLDEARQVIEKVDAAIEIVQCGNVKRAAQVSEFIAARGEYHRLILGNDVPIGHRSRDPGHLEKYFHGFPRWVASTRLWPSAPPQGTPPACSASTGAESLKGSRPIWFFWIRRSDRRAKTFYLSGRGGYAGCVRHHDRRQGSGDDQPQYSPARPQGRDFVMDGRERSVLKISV